MHPRGSENAERRAPAHVATTAGCTRWRRTPGSSAQHGGGEAEDRTPSRRGSNSVTRQFGGCVCMMLLKEKKRSPNGIRTRVARIKT